ncbi:MAG: sulfite exporter TauE/SafE family protein [Cyanobacteria bacterium J06632_3]
MKLSEIALFVRSRPFILVSSLSLLLVWSLWLLQLGPGYAFANLFRHWAIALTMFFGSIVAGGTSMGGGVVAFPVMTKALAIPPQEAKVFSLAIQTIGMGAASLTIIALGTQLPWAFIRFASLGGIVGMWLGTVVFAPLLSASIIRFTFTIVLSSFAVALILWGRRRRIRLVISYWNHQSRIIAIVTGIVGGIASGLVGTGIDIVAFSVLVLMFNLCEKVSTPTSVILMAINAAAGFFIHCCVLSDFTPIVQQYWFAAIPVVVLGAPAGAIACSYLSRQKIVMLLVGLIALELSSSLLLIPLSGSLAGFGIIVFLIFLFLYYAMHKMSGTLQRCP